MPFAHKNILILFLFILSLFVSGKTFSAAGDSIDNTATINYVIGGTPVTDTATESFVEDRLINFVVNEDNGGIATPVISNMTEAVIRFTVSNTGNGVQDFLLFANNTSPNPLGLPVDNFEALSFKTFVESTVPTSKYVAGDDTAIFIDELNPGETSTVYVVANIGSLNIDDVVAAVVLVAQVAEGGSPGVQGDFINSDNNARISPAGNFSNGGTVMPDGVSNTVPDSTAEETVFNDPAGLNPEDVSTENNQDIAGNGQHADAGAYQVSSPVIITKSVIVLDTFGGNGPHPGATLQYRLEVMVVGNTPVDKLIINDVIPANTNYVVESITLERSTVPGVVVQTDADDVDDFTQVIGSPVTSIEVDLSEENNISIGSGVTYTITFEVIIN